MNKVENFVRLNDGHTMPMVGFGTYQMARRITQQCVEQALETGYRHIDTGKRGCTGCWQNTAHGMSRGRHWPADRTVSFMTPC